MPSNLIRYLALDEAVEIHTRLVQRFGGTAGIRDLGLLESALFRPRTGYYEDIAEMAAALFESLLMNHPFVDGNKRTAMMAAHTFLFKNGYRVEATNEEVYAVTMAVIIDKAGREAASEFYRNHIRPR